MKLQGNKSQNPSWRYVCDLSAYDGLRIRAQAPCQLPDELRHHGLVWEVDAREPLLVFSAVLRSSECLGLRVLAANSVR